MEEIEKLAEKWLSPEGPLYLVKRVYLIPVGGKNAVFFPPTFAIPEGEDKDVEKLEKQGINPYEPYIIDELGEGRNTCLIDTVQSQANRLEPIFKKDDLKFLVPQVEVVAGNAKPVNLLDLGHRVADTLIRCSELEEEIKNALQEFGEKGNAEPLAKIAPTSLIFGAWDSRRTRVKIGRILRSEIRAFNVKRATRAAQYKAPIDYIEEGALEVEKAPEDLLKHLQKLKKDEKTRSKYGIADVPSRAVGGVFLRPDGDIIHEMLLNLIAVRSLNGERRRELQNYILGLALLAFVWSQDYYLREGCSLVQDTTRKIECEEVYRTGDRQPIDGIEYRKVLEFAKSAAERFGVETKPIRKRFFPLKLAEVMDKEERKKKEKRKT